MDRRTFARIAAVGTLAFNQQSAYAVGETTQSQYLLEARSAENSLTTPPYGMEAQDIFYPSYFQGSWKALSKTKEIIAPCGFGECD